MRPTEIAVNEHVASIGPWAWLGWVLFALMAALYTMLWRGSRPHELRRLNEALDEARKTIARLEKLEIQLKNRNDELHTVNTKLHADYNDLRDQHSRLNQAFAKLGETVSEIRKELNELREKYDAQFLELMRARAKNGDL